MLRRLSALGVLVAMITFSVTVRAQSDCESARSFAREDAQHWWGLCEENPWMYASWSAMWNAGYYGACSYDREEMYAQAQRNYDGCIAATCAGPGDPCGDRVSLLWLTPLRFDTALSL